MKWQAELMKKYDIDGMCFYHYYFKGGRKILEKPAENLLKWRDIDMPFCFSWANEPWVRSWGNLNNGNSWSEVMDKNVVHGADDDGVLIEQNYGGREEWENISITYCLSFKMNVICSRMVSLYLCSIVHRLLDV